MEHGRTKRRAHRRSYWRALTPPEDYAHIRQLKWARNRITCLGLMFVIFGVLVSLVTKNPTVLAIDLILAALMGALFFGRIAPWASRL